MEKLGLTKFRMELTKVLIDVEENQKVVLLQDRHHRAAGIIPAALAQAIDAAGGVQAAREALERAA